MFKYRYLQIIPIIIIFGLSISLFLGGRDGLPFEYYTKQIIASWYPSYDNENKLKFVTNQTEEYVIGVGERFEKPVEILDKSESGGFIHIKTHDKSPVVCPIDATVNIDSQKKCIVITKRMLKVELYGFEIIGVADGQKVKCGEVLGTLSGNTLSTKIFIGKKAMSMSELRALL